MTLDAVLDVAVGLTFFFALLALLASSIQEIIATVLSTRGKILRQMIKQILGDRPGQTPAPTPTQSTDLATRVLAHPLIAGLATSNLPAWLDRWIKTAPLPSYIPSGNFATALVETLRTRQDVTLEVGSQVSRAVDDLPDGSPLKQALQGFVVEAKGDLDLLRKRIQTWYDDAMDRASGAYKRYAQYMLLAIGLVLAIVINADVLSIAGTLWQDKNAREVVSLAAQQYMQSQPQPATAANAEGAAIERIKQASGLIASLPIPLGWANVGDTLAQNPLLLPRKLVGFLLTAFAVSLGAPFWFDMLQNIANLRGAGPKPARADGTPAN